MLVCGAVGGALARSRRVTETELNRGKTGTPTPALLLPDVAGTGTCQAQQVFVLCYVRRVPSTFLGSERRRTFQIGRIGTKSFSGSSFLTLT